MTKLSITISLEIREKVLLEIEKEKLAGTLKIIMDSKPIWSRILNLLSSLLPCGANRASIDLVP